MAVGEAVHRRYWQLADGARTESGNERVIQSPGHHKPVWEKEPDPS